MSLSTPQIAAQLERVLASDPSPWRCDPGESEAALARVAEASAGGSSRCGGASRRWPSAKRCAMSSSMTRSGRGLVVITPLATHEVAEDIAARLARARVFQPEGWDIVRQLFQAKETDARLGRYAWMPQALIDGAAQGPYPPVANGFLDLETAWRRCCSGFWD
jgi:hypothetical protein